MAEKKEEKVSICISGITHTLIVRQINCHGGVAEIEGKLTHDAWCEGPAGKAVWAKLEELGKIPTLVSILPDSQKLFVAFLNREGE